MPTTSVNRMSAQPHPAKVRLLPWNIPAWAVDAVLIFVTVLGSLRRPFEESGGPVAADWFALVAGVVLLLTRRRFPLSTLAVAVVATAAVVIAIDGPTMLLAVSMVVLYTVGLESERRVALVAGSATIVIFAGLFIVLLEQGTVDGSGLAAIAWPAFAVAAGIGVRTSRLNVFAVQERARQAEASREVESQRRVVEERLRIARDVHDLVAHHIAVINVQSGVAGHLLESNPEAAGQALGLVRGAASTVVDQLGELLGVLRSPDDVGEPIAPTPDLAAIEDLISSFAASGLEVRRETSGSRREFSGSAQLAAYRVVQEALTNAHKYGSGVVDVARHFDQHGLEIIVSNPIDGTAEAGSGFGLVGMRERVEAVGGTLETGPTPDGHHFRVVATIPVKAES